MASVDVNILSVTRVFDELSSPIERLLRNPKGKVDGDEQSITRFVLDDDFFYHVQTYVKTGMEFPDDEHLFEMVNPPIYFKTWLQEDVEYRVRMTLEIKILLADSFHPENVAGDHYRQSALQELPQRSHLSHCQPLSVAIP